PGPTGRRTQHSLLEIVPLSPLRCSGAGHDSSASGRASTLKRTFAVQRSCALEQPATTFHPCAVRLFLSNVQKVSPAHAPSPSITASKKPFRFSRAEQALASTPHIPTKGSAGSIFKRLRSVTWS